MRSAPNFSQFCLPKINKTYEIGRVEDFFSNFQKDKCPNHEKSGQSMSIQQGNFSEKEENLQTRISIDLTVWFNDIRN